MAMKFLPEINFIEEYNRFQYSYRIFDPPPDPLQGGGKLILIFALSLRSKYFSSEAFIQFVPGTDVPT